MNKVIACVLVATATLAAGTARAGGVSWSIDINTPVIGTVISNGPAYRVPAYAVPVYVQAPAYATVPVYAEPYQPEYRPEYRTVYRHEYRHDHRPVYRVGHRDDYRDDYRDARHDAYHDAYHDGHRVTYRPVPIVYGREGRGQRGRHEGRRNDRDERHEGWQR